MRRAVPGRPGAPGRTRARHDLHERDVDEARLALRLVNGRDAELRQRVERGHSASTTCGMSRWKASAKRISDRPEIRRAWFARCPARSSLSWAPR